MRKKTITKVAAASMAATIGLLGLGIAGCGQADPSAPPALRAVNEVNYNDDVVGDEAKLYMDAMRAAGAKYIPGTEMSDKVDDYTFLRMHEVNSDISHYVWAFTFVKDDKRGNVQVDAVLKVNGELGFFKVGNNVYLDDTSITNDELVQQYGLRPEYTDEEFDAASSAVAKAISENSDAKVSDASRDVNLHVIGESGGAKMFDCMTYAEGGDGKLLDCEALVDGKGTVHRLVIDDVLKIDDETARELMGEFVARRAPAADPASQAATAGEAAGASAAPAEPVPTAPAPAPAS